MVEKKDDKIYLDIFWRYSKISKYLWILFEFNTDDVSSLKFD